VLWLFRLAPDRPAVAARASADSPCVFLPRTAVFGVMSPAWILEGGSWMAADSEPVRLRRGDPDAFDALLARYQNRLYRYLLRLTANAAVAEDLFQDTWLKVITRIHRYDERRPFEPWLFSVARNLAIDHLRKTSPESLDEPTQGGLSRSAQVGSPEPGALERWLEHERRALLERRLEELPPLYREALSLRFEEEMSFEEIAEVLSAPLSTVKSRVQRALALLRKRMS
jgi:RNA polymerase sigma-70 factor (ECF subfamily)